MNMKISGGEAGYIKYRKRILAIKLLLEAGIIAGLLILGYTQAGTRKNLLTIVAIIGCLPASKIAVLLLTILPYKTVSQNIITDLEEKAALLTKVYDTVLTSTEKILPVDCFVISGNTICGYASHKKADPAYTADFIKQILKQNGYEGISVKIFREYHAFLTRAEGMNKIASVERNQVKDLENGLKQLLVNISM